MNQALEQGLEEESLVRLALHTTSPSGRRIGLTGRGRPLLVTWYARRASAWPSGSRFPSCSPRCARLLPAAGVRGRRRRAPSRVTLRRRSGTMRKVARLRLPSLSLSFSQARLEDHLRGLDGYAERERNVLLIRARQQLEDPSSTRAMAYTPAERAGSHAAAYGPQTIELAGRLGLPELAAELREAIGDGSDPRNPLAIVLARREGYARHPGVVAQLEDLLHRVRGRRAARRSVGLFFRTLERFGYRRLALVRTRARSSASESATHPDRGRPAGTGRPRRLPGPAPGRAARALLRRLEPEGSASPLATPVGSSPLPGSLRAAPSSRPASSSSRTERSSSTTRSPTPRSAAITSR